jgi:uncharacterized membrane protein
MGALCGAAVGISGGWALGGAVAGVIGAGIGTLAGANIRGRLARSFGQDRPAAIIEDVVAIVAAFLIVAALP